MAKGGRRCRVRGNQRSFKSKTVMVEHLTIPMRRNDVGRLGGMVLSAVVAFAPTGPAIAAERIALVIGNGGYEHLAPLDHVGDDMMVMADTLRNLDFDVDALADLDRLSMRDRLEDFSRRIDQAGDDTVGLLFYAGHGFQLEGSNYILPIDANIAAADEVEEAAINLDLALAEIAFATNDHKLVILDVPAANAVGENWGALPGLTEIDAPVGTLVAYGSLPGTNDDKPPYEGLYPLALANALAKPGLLVEQAFQEVRLNVAQATGGIQIPWESSSLVSPLYLAGPPKQGIESADASEEETADFAGIDPRTVDLVSWTSIKDSTDPADFTDYLDGFPDGVFKDLAERRLKQLSEQNSGDSLEGKASYEVEALDDRLITQNRTNVRAEPSNSGMIVATVEPNQRVHVTGKVADSEWFKISLNGDVEAFIWSPLLGELPPSNGLDDLAATLPPSRSALLGRWQGEYQCQWDTIGFALDIADDHDDVAEGINAVFSFFPLPESPSLPSGSFAMTGDYDAEDGTIILKSGDWIERPLGLQRHDLAGRAEIGGTAISGRIETPGCSDFYLSRDGGQGLPTAQSTPVQ